MNNVKVITYNALVEALLTGLLNGRSICDLDETELRSLIESVKSEGGDIKKYLDGVRQEIKEAKKLAKKSGKLKSIARKIGGTLLKGLSLGFAVGDSLNAKDSAAAEDAARKHLADITNADLVEGVAEEVTEAVENLDSVRNSKSLLEDINNGEMKW